MASTFNNSGNPAGGRVLARRPEKERGISAADLQAAVRHFVDSGGIIQKLPAEKQRDTRRVGERWNAFEMGGEPQ